MNASNRERQYSVLVNLSALPKKIVSLHGQDHVASFVLHALSHPGCFNLNKAAYFVDNPDFNCMKGIAGYSQDEHHAHDYEHMWQDPHAFIRKINNSAFSQKVRDFTSESVQRMRPHDQVIVDDIAHTLRLKEPAYMWWPMKHENHGLLVYEQGPQHKECADLLENGIHYFSFCPVH